MKLAGALRKLDEADDKDNAPLSTHEFSAFAPKRRLEFLDGIRGWAAVTVLFYHLFLDGLPANAIMADRTYWSKVFFLNGETAVCAFFIVSGLSLSIGYVQRRDLRTLVRLAAGRYFRLAIPIFAICLAVYLLMISGIIMSAPTRPALNGFLTFAPSPESLLSFSLYKVFFAYTRDESFAPPLWTMSIEFLGSFMVVGMLATLGALRFRAGIYIVVCLALAAAQSYYSLFVFGMLLAEVYVAEVRLPSWVWVGLLAVSLALTLLPSRWHVLVYFGGTCGLVATAAFFAPIREIFESRLSTFLGRISFPLYLVHAPVIYAFTLWVLIGLENAGFDFSARRWIACAISVPVCLWAAVAFDPVNRLAIFVARAAGNAAVNFMSGMRVIAR